MGLSMHVCWLTTLRDQILVPTAAVQHNGVQAFVYVIRDGAVHLQPVAEVGTEGDDAAITGLQAGDVVAITGFDKIRMEHAWLF